jgi:hypothetical protein
MVFQSMLAYVETEGSASQKRFSWLIEAFVDEALAEMADGSPEQTAAFFDELSRLIHWVATGELNGEQTEELKTGFKPLAQLEAAPEAVDAASK